MEAHRNERVEVGGWYAYGQPLNERLGNKSERQMNVWDVQRKLALIVATLAMPREWVLE